MSVVVLETGNTETENMIYDFCIRKPRSNFSLVKFARHRKVSMIGYIPRGVVDLLFDGLGFQ